MRPAGDSAPSVQQGIVILCPFIIYPTIDFIYRIANGIIAPSLSIEFGLSAAELGLVSSVFFFAFGLSQLPLGVALDRFGPRAVTLSLLAIAILGALLFIIAEGMVSLLVGRILLGIGMSASLIAGIKTATIWLPGRLPLATSLLVGATGLGGMVATAPFAELLEHFPWRTGFLGLTGFMVLLFILTMVLVPSVSKQTSPGTAEQFRSYIEIFKSRFLWRYSPIAMAAIGVGSAYQTLWAPLWMRDVAGFAPGKIAWVLFTMMGCYAAGNFAFGWLAQRCQQQGRSPMAVILPTICLLIMCQLLLALGITAAAAPLWIASSILLAGAYAIYPIISGHFPVEFAARASTALNFLVFATVFAVQWLLGLIIGMFPETVAGHFSAEAHSWALMAAISVQALALAWYGISRRLS